MKNCIDCYNKYCCAKPTGSHKACAQFISKNTRDWREACDAVDRIMEET